MATMAFQPRAKKAQGTPTTADKPNGKAKAALRTPKPVQVALTDARKLKILDTLAKATLTDKELAPIYLKFGVDPKAVGGWRRSLHNKTLKPDSAKHPNLIALRNKERMAKARAAITTKSRKKAIQTRNGNQKAKAAPQKAKPRGQKRRARPKTDNFNELASSVTALAGEVSIIHQSLSRCLDIVDTALGS